MENTTGIAIRMPEKVWTPPTPQLIKDARMMIVGYKSSLDAIREVLPPGLEPHPNGMVQMNMYEVQDNQTSGFGPFSLTYLTVEIAGHESYAAEGGMAIPGRYFAYYWNSSPRVRAYVSERVGVQAMPGVRRTESDNGNISSILTVDGRDVIRMKVSATEDKQGTLGGHLNYYSLREFPRPEGGTPVLSELLEFPLPFVMDMYSATVDEITFDFPDGHPAMGLAPTEPLETPSVLYADVTFTYSMGRQIRNYL
jgi:hypothetical protein